MYNNFQTDYYDEEIKDQARFSTIYDKRLQKPDDQTSETFYMVFLCVKNLIAGDHHHQK